MQYVYSRRLAGLGQDATAPTPSLTNNLVSKLKTPAGLAIAAGLAWWAFKDKKSVTSFLRRFR